MAKEREAISIEIASRLRHWYEGGEMGITKICERTGASEEVVAAMHHWYEQGSLRMKKLAEDIEKLGTM